MNKSEYPNQALTFDEPNKRLALSGLTCKRLINPDNAKIRRQGFTSIKFLQNYLNNKLKSENTTAYIYLEEQIY